MTRYFSHYWCYDRHDLQGAASGCTPLDHTAGSLFTPRGVRVGDLVYAVTVKRGVFFLIGKLQVGEIVFSDRQAEARLRYEPWPGPEHLIASSCTPVQLVQLPLAIVSSLRFERGRGEVALKFVVPGVLDRQTVRGVRRLTYESAVALDEFLPQMEPFSANKPSFWRDDAGEGVPNESAAADCGPTSRFRGTMVSGGRGR
jgi:hypothetical protein